MDSGTWCQASTAHRSQAGEGGGVGRAERLRAGFLHSCLLSFWGDVPAQPRWGTLHTCAPCRLRRGGHADSSDGCPLWSSWSVIPGPRPALGSHTAPHSARASLGGPHTLLLSDWKRRRFVQRRSSLATLHSAAWLVFPLRRPEGTSLKPGCCQPGPLVGETMAS